MNQIAASILVLSATICGYTSAIRPHDDGFGGILGLIALGLGIWGTMSLLTSSVRERERMLEDTSSMPSIGASAVNGLRNLASSYVPPARYAAAREYRLPPEVDAQVAVAAQMRGQNRNQVIEETLRRHLPRSTSSRVA
jgi:hypothetical protein